MGSSREIAIGPVAVVSMLLSSMIGEIQDPLADPVAYRNFVFTVTLFAGTFQAIFGLFRYVMLSKWTFNFSLLSTPETRPVAQPLLSAGWVFLWTSFLMHPLLDLWGVLPLSLVFSNWKGCLESAISPPKLMWFQFFTLLLHQLTIQ